MLSLRHRNHPLLGKEAGLVEQKADVTAQPRANDLDQLPPQRLSTPTTTTAPTDPSDVQPPPPSVEGRTHAEVAAEALNIAGLSASDQWSL